MTTEADRISLLKALLKSIESYHTAFEMICSIVQQTSPGTTTARSICLSDTPGVLDLFPAAALRSYLETECSSFSPPERPGDVFVVDVDSERSSLDTFDAVTLAFAAGLHDQPPFRNGNFKNWQNFLVENGQALRGISYAELRNHRPRLLEPALLIVRGIQSRRAEPLGARVASAVSAASALGFGHVLFIASSDVLPVLRTVWVDITREQFNKATLSVLKTLGPTAFSRESATQPISPRAFWVRLRSLANLLPQEGDRPPRGPEEQERLRRDTDTRERARSLMVAATFPSVRNLFRLVEHFTQYAQMWEQNATAKDPDEAQRPTNGRAHAQHENDSTAPREALLHAVFLTSLETVRPGLIHAVNADPSGWQQLFRLQLIFCRLNSTERLLLGMRNAEWDVFHDDALLRAFFWRAMGVVTAPLVEPFTSATAMRRHFKLMLAGGTGEDRAYHEDWTRTMIALREIVTHAEGTLDAARRAKRDADVAASNVEHAQGYLVKVADSAPRPLDSQSEVLSAVLSAVYALIEARDTLQTRTVEKKLAAENAEELPDVPTELELAVEQGVFLQRGPPQSEVGAPQGRFELVDATERSLRIVGLVELLGKMQHDLSPALRDAVQEAKVVFEEAAQDPDDSLAADALVGLARLLLAVGDASSDERDVGRIKERTLQSADLVLQKAEMRVSNDPLGKLAVKLGKALLYEFQGLAPKAAEVAREVVIAADTIGARELTARAVSIALRCDKTSFKKPAWRRLARTQAFIDVQSARSPLVSDRVDESRRKLFVSYRTETRDFSKFLVESVRRPDGTSPLNVWVDYDAIDANADDFREAMQLGLDRSGAVLIVLSPGYFRSHWCSYELATTLARRRTAGLRMQWIAITPEEAVLNAGLIQDPVTYVRQLAETAAFTPDDRRYMQSQIDQLVAQPPLMERIVRIGDLDQYKEVLDRLRGWLDSN